MGSGRRPAGQALFARFFMLLRWWAHDRGPFFIREPDGTKKWAKNNGVTAPWPPTEIILLRPGQRVGHILLSQLWKGWSKIFLNTWRFIVYLTVTNFSWDCPLKLHSICFFGSLRAISGCFEGLNLLRTKTLKEYGDFFHYIFMIN
jgi:hypothetical protein